MRHKENRRTALFKNLVQSLIISEKIQTTEAKAKAIKGLVDKLINQAKSPTSRRLVSQFLVKKEVREKLIKDLVPKLKSRSSGYTSIVKLGRRLGDGAMMVQMRLLVEDTSNKKPASQGEQVTSNKDSGDEKKSRAGRSGNVSRSTKGSRTGSSK